MEAQHWGLPNTITNAAHKSQGTWDYVGPIGRLTNVLESGDSRGLQPNNERTNTLYESQWCDDVAEVQHMRHNQIERH